jgi:hypothetical protein
MDALRVLRVTGGGRRARQVFHKLVFDAVRLLLPSCLAAQRPQAQVFSSFLIPGLCELCAGGAIGGFRVSCSGHASGLCVRQTRQRHGALVRVACAMVAAHARQLCAQRERGH